jgi:hypothetical protein
MHAFIRNCREAVRLQGVLERAVGGLVAKERRGELFGVHETCCFDLIGLFGCMHL